MGLTKDKKMSEIEEKLSKYYKVDESTMTVHFGVMAFDKALDKLAEKMLPIMY